MIKFDFVYWTGDLPPHNIWNQTRPDQIFALRKLTQLFQKYFPNKVIYPALGNHEVMH
jgi:sphingomyelin phosphodiesterase